MRYYSIIIAMIGVVLIIAVALFAYSLFHADSAPTGDGDHQHQHDGGMEHHQDTGQDHQDDHRMHEDGDRHAP